ncbi:MAG TPA: MFS transporter [Desulfuromonadaceae bacterium]
MPRPRPTANSLLILLLGVNLLNYIDRQVVYAVFPLIKQELGLSDTALGLLGSAFMVCYMVAAPLFGLIGDRFRRTRVAASALAAWSLATLGAGLSSGYRTLLTARTLVGLGEAAFGTISPGLVADSFERERRGRVLSYFFLAIPVGSALGYLLGGMLGQRFGWRAAFLMVGAPGLALTLPLWRLVEPGRRGDGPEAGATPPAARSWSSLFVNRSFVITTLAMAAMTFALGGLAQWLPTFLFRMHGLDVGRANTIFGGITVVAGITGTLCGGKLGDYFQQRSPAGYLQVSGWGLLIGVPAAAWALLTPSLPLCLVAMFVAEFFLFLNTGPLNTVIVNVTRPGIRAFAFSVNIFFIHALGDAVSPTILGRLSDLSDLRSALLVTPAAILLAGLFCFAGGRFIRADLSAAEAP